MPIFDTIKRYLFIAGAGIVAALILYAVYQHHEVVSLNADNKELSDQIDGYKKAIAQIQLDADNQIAALQKEHASEVAREKQTTNNLSQIEASHEIGDDDPVPSIIGHNIDRLFPDPATSADHS